MIRRFAELNIRAATGTTDCPDPIPPPDTIGALDLRQKP
jgi:hypothetical protein